MSRPDAILLALPQGVNDDPVAMTVAADAIVWRGRYSALGSEVDAEALASIPVTVLVPASLSTFRRVASQGLEPKQEIAVAKIRASEDAIGGAHAAACFDSDGRVVVATAATTLLQIGVERFLDADLNVIAAVPAGAVLRPPAGEIWRGDIAGEAIVASHDFACIDEPELAALLFGDMRPSDLSEQPVADALVMLAKSPQPNFIEGLRLRRPINPLFSAENWIWAKRLALLALGLLVAAILVHWARVERAISRENGRALAAAQKIDPAISDIEQAEAAVDAALARKGIERNRPSMLLAIVWQSVRASDNVALSNVTLQTGGLLTATLSAPDVNSANTALLAIQRAGYQITAKPRRDQSGTTLVDLTVRAP